MEDYSLKLEKVKSIEEVLRRSLAELSVAKFYLENKNSLNTFYYERFVKEVGALDGLLKNNKE